MNQVRRVVIIVYPGVTLLDAAGPAQGVQQCQYGAECRGQTIFV